MIAAKQNNKEAFLTWAVSVLPAQRYKWLESNILKLEHFAVSLKMIYGSIFDITEMPTLEAIHKSAEKNKIFRIKNRKFIKNINDDFEVYIKYISEIAESKKQFTNIELEAEEDFDDSINATVLKDTEFGFYTVDFNGKEDMAYTKPRRIIFQRKELSAPSSWKNVYVNVVSVLYLKYPNIFRNMSSIPGSGRLDFGKIDDTECMISPIEIYEGFYAETNFSAADFIKRMISCKIK